MANQILLKRASGSDPTASDLSLGEIAIRTDNGKLFTKKDNGTVAEISGAGGGNNFSINTLSSSSGSGGGSASFNGTATRFTLSNPPNIAAQLLVSINGVIQKPNTGTSPSEGFAVDGNDIIFSSAPASGADFFILTYASLAIAEPSDNTVTSAKIVDGAIVNADINASAAIAGTKIDPDFGAQNIVTTGQISGKDLILSDTTPVINFNDSTANPDYQLNNTNGVFNIRDTTNSVDRLVVNTDGHVDVTGNLDVGAGIDVTGAITGTGNVEIGSSVTNQFSHKLCIEDTSGSIFYAQHSTSGIQLKLNLDNTNNVALFGTVSSDDLQFVTANNNSLRIDSSGRVGIGTTSPDQLFHVSTGGDTSVRFSGDRGNADNLHIANIEFENTFNNQGVIAEIRAITGNSGTQSSQGQLAFYTDNGSSLAERMRIDSSGRVGIGTTNMGAYNSSFDNFVIRGSGNTGMTISTDDNSFGQIAFSNAEDAHVSGAIQYRNSDNILELRAGESNGAVIFSTVSNTERMRIGSDGSTMFNRTNTTINTSNFGASFIMMNAVNGSVLFKTSRDASGSFSTAEFFGTGGQCKILGDGDIQNTNNSYGQISDETLKQDIVDAASQWNDIKAIKVRKFRFKDNPTGDLQIGVVAQEIEKVSPKLVKEIAKSSDDINSTETVKAVKYSILYMKAIKALQEAMTRIETLETKVTALEAK